MPKRGQKPEWESDENKKRIFIALLNRPASFTELLKQFGFSTATLTKHLRVLEKEKVIERTIEKGRVYRVVLNEETILSELKSMHFNTLLALISNIYPDLAKLWEGYLKSLTKVVIQFKKRELEGKLRLSAKELMIQTMEIIQSTSSLELRKLIHIDEILEDLRKKPESEFQKIEEIRKSLEKKGDKKDDQSS